MGNIPEEKLLHTFDNETGIFVHDDLENGISADEVLKLSRSLKIITHVGMNEFLDFFF